MATIYKEFFINAEPAFVWEALKDVGAVDTRLAKGFVTDCVLSGDERTVTFANGFVARERIVSVSDELRRIAYALVGGTTSHHNASFQVLDAPRGHSRVLWFTDLLPDDMRPTIAEMVEQGAVAIRETLEAAALASSERK
jgi:carbon monoxide dehydrogenase subunit G